MGRRCGYACSTNTQEACIHQLVFWGGERSNCWEQWSRLPRFPFRTRHSFLPLPGSHLLTTSSRKKAKPILLQLNCDLTPLPSFCSFQIGKIQLSKWAVFQLVRFLFAWLKCESDRQILRFKCKGRKIKQDIPCPLSLPCPAFLLIVFLNKRTQQASLDKWILIIGLQKDNPPTLFMVLHQKKKKAQSLKTNGMKAGTSWELN